MQVDSMMEQLKKKKRNYPILKQMERCMNMLIYKINFFPAISPNWFSPVLCGRLLHVAVYQ